MELIRLLKALCVLGIVLMQWACVVLNLNRYGIFQSFIDMEFLEGRPEKENALAMEDLYGENLFT